MGVCESEQERGRRVREERGSEGEKKKNSYLCKRQCERRLSAEALMLNAILLIG